MMQEIIHTILTVTGSGRTLAVPIEAVREVVPAFEILRTPVPAPAVIGMISLRGEVLPIIDAGLLVGCDGIPLHPQHKFVVIDTSSQTCALLVEAVGDLIEISSTRLFDPSAGRTSLPVAGIVAVDDEMVLLLDVEACGRIGKGIDGSMIEAVLHEAEGISS